VRLQEQIVGQGREIEKFIQAHVKLNKLSAAFRAPVTLFNLFKSNYS
jgi:hypothetical protein